MRRCELVVRSRHPAALEEWYREALGGGPVALRVEDGPGLAARAREPMRLVPNLVVDDIDGVERRLIAMGAAWLRELDITRWGGIATALDPDGNVAQFLEGRST